MINFIVKNTEGKRLIIDPDAEFDQYDNILDICKSSKEIRDILYKVDGIQEFTDLGVVTKYGLTNIQNIQTGSKSMILMTLNSSYMVRDFEVGLNILKLMIKSNRIYNIFQVGRVQLLDKNDKALVDNTEFTGIDSIRDAIDNKKKLQ